MKTKGLANLILISSSDYFLSSKLIVNLPASSVCQVCAKISGIFIWEK